MKVYEVTEEEFDKDSVVFSKEPGTLIIVRLLCGLRALWRRDDEGDLEPLETSG